MDILNGRHTNDHQDGKGASSYLEHTPQGWKKANRSLQNHQQTPQSENITTLSRSKNRKALTVTGIRAAPSSSSWIDSSIIARQGSNKDATLELYGV
jgi:hypothetical protein